MLYRVLPVLVLSVTAALTAAAVEYLPETLYFSVIEYSTPEHIRIALYKNGEFDRSDCEQGASRAATAIRASCPTCKVEERCVRGLDVEHRKILSREPLSTPSVRMPGGKLTMTLSTNDQQVALGVCRQAEQHSASLPIDQRLRCFPALALR